MFLNMNPEQLRIYLLIYHAILQIFLNNSNFIMLNQENQRKNSQVTILGVFTFRLCQFLYFKRIIWSKNDWAFTPVPASAGASRINDEDAPNHRVSQQYWGQLLGLTIDFPLATFTTLSPTQIVTISSVFSIIKTIGERVSQQILPIWPSKIVYRADNRNRTDIPRVEVSYTNRCTISANAL